MKITAGAVVLILAAVTPLWSQTTLYSIGQPTDEEQLYVELINRARANPTAEGIMLAETADPSVQATISQYNVDLAMLKTEFADLPVRPPLAINTKLTQMARGHSADLLVRAVQSHFGVNEEDVTDRAVAAGYAFGSLGENVYAFSTSVFFGHAGFQIDWGDGLGGMQPGRGHRVNIHGDYREVGVGLVYGTKTNAKTNETVGPQLVTQNFGRQQNSPAYVTGVAYYDLNSNGFYDPGEGIGGVTVNVNGSSFHGVTANSGGYAVPVPTANASHAVTFSGLGFHTASDATIANGENVKVDFKPAYSASVVTGPAVAAAGSASAYSFTTVGGATRYEWQAFKEQAVLDDGADNLSRVTKGTSGSYSPLSSGVKFSGTAAYHLAHPSGTRSSETLTYPGSFFVHENANLSFRSRLRAAFASQIAKVEVSTDHGSSWTAVYSQPGATPIALNSPQGEESGFALRTASLASFAGKQIKIRFNYDFAGGRVFVGTGDNLGWFIDEVKWSQLSQVSSEVVTVLNEGQTAFLFVPPTPGDYRLSVLPVISGRRGAFGPALNVVATVPSVDITVGLPETPALLPGSSSVNFGPVAIGGTANKTFTILNSGTQPLTGLSVSVAGGTPGEFVTTALPATSLTSGQEMQFSVNFTPTEAGGRSASLSIFSNDPDENPFVIALNGTGSSLLHVTGQPRSVAVKAGQPAAWEVEASPSSGLSYQWKKNNANIKTASGPAFKRYEIPQVKLADAGSYRVAVAGGNPVTTVLSDVAGLAVVEDLPKTLVVQAGKAVTLTANASGPDLKYEWKTNGVSVGSAKVLTLKNLASAQSGTYVCEVRTGDSEPAAGATTILRVFTNPPAVQPVQNMPDGIVGGIYVHQIKFSDAVSVTPTGFSAKNLPAGLKINAKTGEITGRPTKAGTFQVTLIASNAWGPSQTTDEIIIHNYPADLAGSYVGGIERSMINQPQQTGGRLDLVISSLGAFSGSVTQGSTKMAFKGLLDVPLSGGGLPYGEVQIQPPGKPASAVIKLAFSVNPATHRLANASVTQSSQSVTVTGWHQKWNAKEPKATAYLKLHTFGLQLADAGLVGEADIPQGWGYGSFTPSVDGKVSVTGRTADGEKFTGASFIGPSGEVLIYQPLYTTAVKGSLLGALIVNANNALDPDDNTILGGVTWTRPANSAANARTYKAGFGLAGTPEPDPVVLAATGARHVPPTGTQVILNLPAVGTQNAHADFEFGDIASSSDNPDPASLNVEAKSKITVAGPNPAALKLTANATTGGLTGSFALTDPPSLGAKDVKRSVTLQGILIRDGSNYLGVGYFLLPGLSSQAVPVNTTILSGSMTLRKN